MSKLRNLIGRKRWIIFSYVLILGGIATAGVFATTNNVAKNSAEESLLCEEEPEMATSLKKNEGTIEVSLSTSNSHKGFGAETTISLYKKNGGGFNKTPVQEIFGQKITRFFVEPGTYIVQVEKYGYFITTSEEVVIKISKEIKKIFISLEEDLEDWVDHDVKYIMD
mgnify:CR=1 FL=1